MTASLCPVGWLAWNAAVTQNHKGSFQQVTAWPGTPTLAVCAKGKRQLPAADVTAGYRDVTLASTLSCVLDVQNWSCLQRFRDDVLRLIYSRPCLYRKRGGGGVINDIMKKKGQV